MKQDIRMHNESDSSAQISHWNQCLESIAKSRDKQQYMLFYDHFAPRLKSWLLGVTKDDTLAEEIAQETMMTVWRKAHQYDSSKAAASTWIFRIARNLHVDHLRRQQVRDRANWIFDDTETVDYDVHSDGRKIRDEIKKLPVQQAQVIFKSFFEGKSHQEISDEMSIPLGSVKSSLRLAFQKLSKAVRPEI
jgi:RNA polymerase sigma-70 factor (ECF subfamily)